MARIIAFAFVVGLSGLALQAAADGLSQPIAVKNHNPFVQMFGLSATPGGTRAPADALTLSTSYAVASHFEIALDGVGDDIVIDGETERFEVDVRRGIGERWEAAVAVPLVRHSSGYLDGVIIDWHDWFGMPQNGRDIAPRDRLAFVYRGQGGPVDLVDDASGPGDLRLSLGRSVDLGDGSATMVRLQVKLPTGESDELLGSGGTDLALAIDHERDLTPRLRWGLNGAVTALGDGDVLDELVRPFVAQFGTSFAYRVADSVALKLRWDVHSQPYEATSLKQLNEIAYVLSFGGTIRLAPSAYLDLIVTENYPHPEIAPDVAFRVGFRWRL